MGIRLGIICAMLWTCSSAGSAQINLMVGYAGTIGDYDGINEIHRAYEEQFDGNFERGLGDLRYMHNIHMGIRYRYQGLGVELGLETLSQEKRAIGVNAAGGITDRSLTYSFTTYSFGLENYSDRWSIGASIDYRRFRANTDLTGTTATRKRLVRESAAASKFSIGYVLQKSTNVSLVLKGYVQLPWGEYDITALNTELIGSNTESSFSPTIYGLALQFYNGSQRRR